MSVFIASAIKYVTLKGLRRAR